MKKNKFSFEGTIKSFPKKHIYLNINHLDKGNYILKIIYKNKVIKKTSFHKNK